MGREKNESYNLLESNRDLNNIYSIKVKYQMKQKSNVEVQYEKSKKKKLEFSFISDTKIDLILF